MFLKSICCYDLLDIGKCIVFSSTVEITYTNCNKTNESFLYITEKYFLLHCDGTVTNINSFLHQHITLNKKKRPNISIVLQCLFCPLCVFCSFFFSTVSLISR